MRDQEFKGALDDCLERIRQGSSLEECVKAYPQHADRLMPFLTSAATLRGMGVPEPSTSGMQRARNNLLTRVAEGSGKEAAVVRGIFKFANIAGVAVAAVFVAGIGFAAAGTGGLFGGNGSGQTEFQATVVSAAPTLLYVQNNDNSQYVYLVLSNQTQYEDANGNAIGRTDIHVRDRVWVRAMPSSIGARFFDANLIRLGGPPSDPTAPPSQEATKAPEPTEAPKPTDAPETPKPTDAPATPKPTEKPATPKPTDKPVSDKIEFWGVVQVIAPSALQLQTEFGSVIVHVNGETEYPTGQPFVGVKVWVLGTKLDDGSFVGHRITVKAIEFIGQVTAVNGGTFTVNADGQSKTVTTNGETEFPNGVPVVGNLVAVYAFKMGDGSYLAKTMTVKTDVMSFTGVIVQHLPGEFTIKVDVSGTLKVVCYEFAEVQGTLAVGATVLVEVDHVDAGTYFAGLVKVMS
jgi:cell division septation protein DedD